VLAARKLMHGTLDLASGVGVVPEAGDRPVHGALDLAPGVGVVPEAGRRPVHGTLDLAAGVGVVPEAGRGPVQPPASGSSLRLGVGRCTALWIWPPPSGSSQRLGVSRAASRPVAIVLSRLSPVNAPVAESKLAGIAMLVAFRCFGLGADARRLERDFKSRASGA